MIRKPPIVKRNILDPSGLLLDIYINKKGEVQSWIVPIGYNVDQVFILFVNK